MSSLTEAIEAVAKEKDFRFNEESIEKIRKALPEIQEDGRRQRESLRLTPEQWDEEFTI